MNDFFQGMFYIVSGMRHLLTKELKRFILLPVLINFLLFAGIFYLIYHYVFPYALSWTSQLPSWLSFLNGLLLIIFTISFFLLFLSMFTVLFNVVAAPFNGLLAEKAQNLLYQSSIPSISLMKIAQRTIKRQGQFLRYFIPRFTIMIALFFVPFIHPVYPFMWLFFNAWILSIQYQDFVMDNNLIDFEEMRVMVKDKTMLSLGFGFCINLISFVPFLNLLILPAAVIGGVILYCEEHKHPQKMLDKQDL